MVPHDDGDFEVIANQASRISIMTVNVKQAGLAVPIEGFIPASTSAWVNVNAVY